MTYTYTPRGVCAKQITLDVEDGILKSVQFHGGCDGNLKGISSLVSGMPVDEIITRLEGLPCHSKSTSCPDQLAQALKSIAK